MLKKIKGWFFEKKITIEEDYVKKYKKNVKFKIKTFSETNKKINRLNHLYFNPAADDDLSALFLLNNKIIDMQDEFVGINDNKLILKKFINYILNLDDFDELKYWLYADKQRAEFDYIIVNKDEIKSDFLTLFSYVFDYSEKGDKKQNRLLNDKLTVLYIAIFEKFTKVLISPKLPKRNPLFKVRGGGNLRLKS